MIVLVPIRAGLSCIFSSVTQVCADIRTHSLVGGNAPSILVADTRNHTRMRSMLNPGFSDRALKEQEPLFQKYAKLLASKLHSLAASGTPVDMQVWLNFTTFDLMAELALGESLGLLENSKYSDWVEQVITAIKGLPILQIIRFYPLTNWAFATFGAPRLKASRDASLRYTADRVDRRIENGSNQPDLWNLVLKKDAGELSRDEMHSNALVFMTAGTETTGETCFCPNHPSFTISAF